MGSSGAVFSHSSGEFLGIKQLLMGRAATPLMDEAALAPRPLVFKAPNPLALEKDFSGCQQTRWFTPFYLYQLCKKPTLENRPGTR